jgi:hypothetical protein
VGANSGRPEIIGLKAESGKADGRPEKGLSTQIPPPYKKVKLGAVNARHLPVPKFFQPAMEDLYIFMT